MARGRLRIYLGAAPGVGKTFAMLDEGWRRRSRGTDVVIGYVETHNRPNTVAQLRDLELVPRRTFDYRGQLFTEMDVDAVLARKPEVALVDELAHTNVPGSRNEKRWQDVEELLDAGIDVISTVNIQHLESLNDVVENITDIKQRETVPDVFVRAADQVELVDMTPEALRRRMAHGNIYAPEKVDAALGNFFRAGNLGALRELALLWMADKVDAALLDYREQHSIARPWETRERVAVALTGAPGGSDVIRRAARIARRLRAELVGVHVVASDGLASRAGPELSEHLAIVGELGGRYVEVVGDDIAKSIVQAARAENATQIVLGASRRSRTGELVRGSVINSVVRAAGTGIDVHVIASATNDSDASGGVPGLLRRRRRHAIVPLSLRRRLAALSIAVVGLPLLTVVLTHMRNRFGIESALPVYLLVVVLIAAVGGRLPAAFAAVVGFLLLNWYFAPPFYTFTIGNTRDVLALMSFLVVSGVVSQLVDVAARRRADATRAQSEARALAAMAATVLQEPEPLPSLASQLVSAFALDGVSVLAHDDGVWSVLTCAGVDPPSSRTAATLALDLDEGTALAINGRGLRADDRQLLTGFANQLAVALRGARLQQEAAHATALARGNELRSALLQAVSHDLRTPLASIRAAATSLLADDIEWNQDEARELLGMIDGEAERLNRIVANLLDMSRLRTGSVDLRLQPVGLDEVVAGAVTGLHATPGRLHIDLPESLPQVLADPAVLERAVANVVENALRYSPEAEPVSIVGATDGDAVQLRVIDHGPGIPQALRDSVYEPFQRLGDQPNGIGVGLGLAVAKGFVEAHGGSIAIDDALDHGCTMVLTLPAASSRESSP